MVTITQLRIKETVFLRLGQKVKIVVRKSFGLKPIGPTNFDHQLKLVETDTAPKDSQRAHQAFVFAPPQASSRLVGAATP